MACYYYMKLPNGRELRIPTTFGSLSLTNTLELRDLIDNYKNNKDGASSDLISYITNNTPLRVTDFEEILQTISIDNDKISDEDLTSFINLICRPVGK